jgi:hypothetical protein
MNPTPITISGPALLDKAAKAVADILDANLTWLTTAYPKADKRERMKDTQRILYPAVYCGNGEYLSMFPDDALGNFSFLDVQDGYTAEWTPRRIWQVRANAGLVVWFDMRSVYPTTYEQKTPENVKDAVMTALQKKLTPGLRFIINRVWDRTENIYRGYTLSEIDNQFAMRPYGCFRLDGELTYEYHC